MKNLKKLALSLLIVGAVCIAGTAFAQSCSIGAENRAIAMAKLEVGADRTTHIFVPVATSEDCDDWLVYKRTPGVYGVTACIVTIVDWVVVDVECFPTGP